MFTLILAILLLALLPLLTHLQRMISYTRFF